VFIINFSVPGFMANVGFFRKKNPISGHVCFLTSAWTKSGVFIRKKRKNLL